MLRTVPKTRKGPKGIMLFAFFFFPIIKATPMIDPKTEARKIAKKTRGQPKINPIKKPSFASPPPIPFPFVKIIIAKKKPNEKNAAKI